MRVQFSVRHPNYHFKNGLVAQLVEHSPEEPGVGSSILPQSTTNIFKEYKSVAQLVEQCPPKSPVVGSIPTWLEDKERRR